MPYAKIATKQATFTGAVISTIEVAKGLVLGASPASNRQRDDDCRHYEKSHIRSPQSGVYFSGASLKSRVLAFGP
jgi:hypothetical protein